MSDASCDVCGWMAAFMSMLAFGSFGVPIKSKTAVALDIDPLVFQSYKTAVCFLTSWIVLIFLPKESGRFAIDFTPWGIVSGLFWVPGGVATVYAIKSVGLALGIGVGSSFIVLVSFCWGIFIFHEHVHSKFAATFAIACMMMGLMGMSYYSNSNNGDSNTIRLETTSNDEGDSDRIEDEDHDKLIQQRIRIQQGQTYQEVLNATLDSVDYIDDDGVDQVEEVDEERYSHKLQTEMPNCRLKRPESVLPKSLSLQSGVSENTSHENYLVEELHADVNNQQACTCHDNDNNVTVLVCGYLVQKRTLGILAAAFCGIWGGSIMAPMKWCKSNTKGTHYLISFAIGASIVNLSLWMFRYLYYLVVYKSASIAYYQLPSFHLRELWLAGGMCGLLWSIGNFFSLISVFYLGEGVGYPLVQTSILVSGLWGIFYYKEVQGFERITKWMCSSLLTIFGILLLSYEHHTK